MRNRSEEIKGLEEAIGRESEAAARAAAAMDEVRGSIEALDPAGQRRRLAEAKEAFDELTRAAALRNSLAARLATKVGLKRENTFAEVASILGDAGENLRSMARVLADELERVRTNVSVLMLLSKYGAAMTASLVEIRGVGRVEAPYGRNGHRTASIARAGRLA